MRVWFRVGGYCTKWRIQGQFCLARLHFRYTSRHSILSLDRYWYVSSIQFPQRKLCTGKIELALDVRFCLDVHSVFTAIGRTLTNGSDVNDVFPRINGSDVNQRISADQRKWRQKRICALLRWLAWSTRRTTASSLSGTTATARSSCTTWTRGWNRATAPSWTTGAGRAPEAASAHAAWSTRAPGACACATVTETTSCGATTRDRWPTGLTYRCPHCASATLGVTAKKDFTRWAGYTAGTTTSASAHPAPTAPRASLCIMGILAAVSQELAEVTAKKVWVR